MSTSTNIDDDYDDNDPHDNEGKEALTKKQLYLEWRRGKVLEYLSQGMNQADIATKLGVAQSTIYEDVKVIRERARERIRSHIDEGLSLEFEKALVTLQGLKQVAFRVMKNTVDDRTKHQAMAMIKECNTTTMDLVSNQGMIDGAMKYVEEVCKRMSGKLMAATESSAAASSSTPITTNPPAALVLENQRVHETVNFVVRNEQTGASSTLLCFDLTQCC